ncbi:LysE family transporter [Nonomuraea sp. NPDC048826]|uniref:LysE family transporter n=1 Tax=Nonomuraea sp. NPDC048826 TaxID=3364347 RepID=UPI00371CA0BB
MSSLTVSLAFGGVVLLGAMSPGPDFAVVVRRSAGSGRGPGMAAALGIAVGVFAWVVAAAPTRSRCPSSPSAGPPSGSWWSPTW